MVVPGSGPSYFHRVRSPEPYQNLATPGPEPDGRQVVEFVNWNQTAPANAGGFNNGNGYPDTEIPGLPAATQNWVVTEAIAYLDLKAGIHQFMVNCDDGFKLTSGPDPRSVFNTLLGLRSPGGSAADVFMDFVVEQDGIYPVRLLWWQGTGSASAEFVVVDRETSARRLINDRTAYFSVNAYRVYTGEPVPYATSVKPAQNEKTVLANSAIEATLVNVGTNNISLMINGISVTPTVTIAGGLTSVRYQPSTPWGLGSTNSVVLSYAGITNAWSFVAQKGPKVLYIVGNPDAIVAGDRAIIDRFAAYGFDVLVVDDTASRTTDADGAVLIVISSNVGSGEVNVKFRDVAVPIVTWEEALQDDLLMTDAVGHGSTGGLTDITITDATHPLAAGLPAGARTVITAPGTMNWGVPGPNAKIVATLADGSGNAAIYAYDKGALLVDGATTAAERRVMLFLLENTYPSLNGDGMKVVDAAFGWAMNTAFPAVQTKLQFNQPTLSGGVVTLTWTGTGKLQESIDLDTWTDVLGNPATGFQVAPGVSGHKFYRLVQ